MIYLSAVDDLFPRLPLCERLYVQDLSVQSQILPRKYVLHNADYAGFHPATGAAR